MCIHIKISDIRAKKVPQHFELEVTETQDPSFPHAAIVSSPEQTFSYVNINPSIPIKKGIWRRRKQPTYSSSTILQQPWPTLWKRSPCPGSWSWTRCPCPCPRSSASRPSPAPPPPRRSAFDEMQGCSFAWRTEFSIFGIVTHPGGWKKCKS